MEVNTEKELHEGVAIGGPYDGRELQSRFPAGVVVVHVPDAVAWIYDRVETPDGSQYECRDRDNGKNGAVRLDQHKAQRAAESRTYDVRALEWE